MTPPLIIRQAQRLGLGIIAVTDHNAVENVAAVQRAAQGSGIAVLAGMELQTREEVHLLCLFDTVEQAHAWQVVVWRALPPLPNREEVFGAQFVVDETGDYVRTEERLLLTSTSLAIEEAVAGVRERGGLPIAAHVDRPSFSLLANLGFIPPGLALAALEVTSRLATAEARVAHPELRGWPLILSGDAHRLSEMRANTLFTVANPSIAELALALRGEGGRKVKLLA